MLSGWVRFIRSFRRDLSVLSLTTSAHPYLFPQLLHQRAQYIGHDKQVCDLIVISFSNSIQQEKSIHTRKFLPVCISSTFILLSCNPKSAKKASDEAGAQVFPRNFIPTECFKFSLNYQTINFTSHTGANRSLIPSVSAILPEDAKSLSDRLKVSQAEPIIYGKIYIYQVLRKSSKLSNILPKDLKLCSKQRLSGSFFLRASIS